jgi:hypothetical protein
MKIEVAKTGFANLPVEKRVCRQSTNAGSFVRKFNKGIDFCFVK